MKTKKRSALARARWDRLLGALIVLIVLIILIVSAFKSCGKNKGPVTDTGSTSIPTADTEEISETVPADNSKAIFLSPSTQEDNVYACDSSVTEESAMFEIAGKVRALLEADGYRVYMCNEDDSVKSKVVRGNELGCGAYVAIHSNACTDGAVAEGTECYYNKNLPGSKALAENIYNRVAELTPTEDRGLKDEEQRTLYEILTNSYPCCLIEVEFHDQEDTSQWILDNEDELAKAIKDGIVAFMKNKEASSVPEETEPEETEPEETEPEELAPGENAAEGDGE